MDAVRKVEPLWLAAFPTALLAAPHADLITSLTGVSNGAKNYYRGSKGLKRCHNVKNENNVQAVTCEIVHRESVLLRVRPMESYIVISQTRDMNLSLFHFPTQREAIVPCLQPHPSAQAANFGNVVLMALRNPLTAFPAYHQSKAELYHGQKGQVEKEQWIEFRDQYVEEKLFAEWKDFIMEWRDMRPYTVGGYMPYEYWADETKGPSLVITLSQILKKEGFPVLYDLLTDDGRRELECLWRKHIYEAIAEEEKIRVEWYVPRYTSGQLEFMATGLDAFAREIEEKQDDGKRPGDEHLVTILRDYRNAIRAEL
jgi:hypothetical protein